MSSSASFHRMGGCRTSKLPRDSNQAPSANLASAKRIQRAFSRGSPAKRTTCSARLASRSRTCSKGPEASNSSRIAVAQSLQEKIKSAAKFIQIALEQPGETAGFIARNAAIDRKLLQPTGQWVIP